MKLTDQYRDGSLMKLTHWGLGGVFALLLLLPGAARAGGVVTNCTEAALRAAMVGGGTVTFACDGIITVTSTITNTLDAVLDATSRQITISGGDAVRVFYVRSNVTFVLNHLTVAHGRSTNGAGLFNDNGTVSATDTTFYGNIAWNAPAPPSWPDGSAGGSAGGGALANSGLMNLLNCSFTNNSTVGGAGSAGVLGGAGFQGGTGAGGAVWNSGLLTVSGCTFAGNSATGGVGGDGGSSEPIPGAQGGPGGPGGDGSGGALFNSGIAMLVNCTLALNAGAGGAGGMGGASYPYPPPSPPPQPGPNGSSGLGFGAIYDASGHCCLTNCTVAFNSCTDAGIGATATAMVNTLVAQNTPANCRGTITDLGHNLSSDTTCGFTNTGSVNNTYALLGPLTDNGGPTATIALLSGSRAIDAGDNAAAPPTDQRGVPRPFGLAADMGAYEYNTPTNPGPSSVVTECTEAGLRAAMSGGGVVTFACDGTITLANTITITTNTMLDAAAHEIMISGGNAVGVFYVTAGVAFSVADLTVHGGRATSGGGIRNTGGLVTATNCVFSGNSAIPGFLARGGAIENESGEVYLSSCVFIANDASGATGADGLSGGSGAGGALGNSGTLTADLCRFIGNSAVGAGGLSPSGGPGHYGDPGGSGGDGEGGAICNYGMMTILRSMFTNNYAGGGKGAGGLAGYFGDPGMSGGAGSAAGSGGAGNGGALYNVGTLRVINTTFADNSGAGGNGGAGGAGGGSAGGPGTSGGSGGRGGAGGTGTGAIFNSGNLQLVNCTFAFNAGAGGNGGAGGSGGSGTYGGNGGSGGTGGSGFGAIFDLGSSCGLTDCTFASDWGGSGAGAAGGGGGIGVYQNGSSGTSGSAGSSGGVRTTGARVANTLLADSGVNCSGYFTDLGHNLSSDSSCGFTNVVSMNNTDPKLGPLANNGGPTLTIALLPGSPAIDAGDNSLAPATDQRGFPRPAGAAADIGAFEYGSVMPTLTVSRANPDGFNFLGSGNTGRLCRLLGSADMSSWVPLATNPIGTNGTVLFHDACTPGAACRFYRLVMP